MVAAGARPRPGRLSLPGGLLGAVLAARRQESRPSVPARHLYENHYGRPGQLNTRCWKGMAYRIDTSPDLSAWTPLATVTNLTGKLQWTDTNAPAQGARFYRAVKQ